MKIENLQVYDLKESLKASGYPMQTELDLSEVNDRDVKRCLNLTKASNGNGAHGQWMTGVRVAFDLTCSNKMWLEAERYRFLEFVSSQSTMHRITQFNIQNQCNEYVDPRAIAIVDEKVEKYNNLCTNRPANVGDTEWENMKKEAYLKILYNVPAGFELTARVTTNYRCLLNIYNQRKDHKLPEWRKFCEEMLKLPVFSSLVKAYNGEVE